MGRKLVSALVVVIFAMSLVVFYAYSGKARKKAAVLGKDEARILMENFSYRKYSGGADEILVSSKIGKITGDSRIILQGDVQAIRSKTDGSDVITADQAIAYFTGTSFMTTSDESELIKIHFDHDVQIKFNNYVINSESAVYLAKEQIITSKVPVQISGQQRTFSSDQGFRYEIATEDLVMYGKIDGEIERKKKDF